MTATIEPSPIVRALRAAHLHDAPRRQLLQLACDRLRALGAPYTSVYAYMLHGDALALEAFAGRETEHTRIPVGTGVDRKSTRLNSSHGYISYAVFCLKKKKKEHDTSLQHNPMTTHDTRTTTQYQVE